MNNADEKDYNNLPNDTILKSPVEEGDVLNQDKENETRPLGEAQDVNETPDSPLVDGNAQEANGEIEDTAEEA
jgi:hypothetical protein